MRWASSSARVCGTFLRLAHGEERVRESVGQIALTPGRCQQDRPAVRNRLWLIERGGERATKEARQKDSLCYGL